VQLRFSKTELQVIMIWAGNTIHGGHWGDGDFAIPEERIILHKLEGVGDGSIDLTGDEAKIILAWSESSRGIHTMEEESALAKLRLVTGGGNR
jgi:hypothetical protein